MSFRCHRLDQKDILKLTDLYLSRSHSITNLLCACQMNLVLFWGERLYWSHDKIIEVFVVWLKFCRKLVSHGLRTAWGNLTNSYGPPCNYQNKFFHWIRISLDPTNSRLGPFKYYVSIFLAFSGPPIHLRQHK